MHNAEDSFFFYEKSLDIRTVVTQALALRMMTVHRLSA